MYRGLISLRRFTATSLQNWSPGKLLRHSIPWVLHCKKKNKISSFAAPHPNTARMSDDLTSLNWLSKLSAADHTITDDSSSSHTRRVYVNTIPDPASASLHGQAFQTKQSATRQRGSNHAARSRAPYHPVDRDIQPVVERKYPRPACSYSCLIAMALKACLTGCLPVSEIYRFIE